ncbi:hypothetical protein T484DRAFT_1890432 [Baffinella frigidus]|nr:hypothetical protein T484DRAFT_1890432 [Cryptophyta sp. CCMP2293]
MVALEAARFILRVVCDVFINVDGGTFRTTLTCITAARVFMYCNQRTNDSIAAEAFNADHFLHVAAEQ